jgi:hypothetical protein
VLTGFRFVDEQEKTAVEVHCQRVNKYSCQYVEIKSDSLFDNENVNFSKNIAIARIVVNKETKDSKVDYIWLLKICLILEN